MAEEESIKPKATIAYKRNQAYCVYEKRKQWRIEIDNIYFIVPD